MFQNFKIKTIFGAFLTISAIYRGSAVNFKYSTTVTIYDQINFKGASIKGLNLDAVDHVNLPDLGFLGDLKSFTIDNGSCVEVHVETPSGPVSDQSKLHKSWDWFRNPKQKNVAANQKIKFLKSCNYKTITTICPSSMYVMEIRWNNDTMLQDGVEIGCSHPSSKTIDTNLRTHGSGTLRQKESCLGFGGIHTKTDIVSERAMNFAPYCYEKKPIRWNYIKDEIQWVWTEACEPDDALVGFETHIEYNTQFVKGIYPICETPNIGRDCRPSDVTNEVSSCRAGNDAVNSIECKREKTIGTTERKSFSESNSLEKKFHSEFGFEIGLSGKYLSANFGGNVKTSTTTGYSWTDATEDAFTKGYTYEISSETPVGYETTYEEVVGNCGFLEVRPHIFRKVDRKL